MPEPNDLDKEYEQRIDALLVDMKANPQKYPTAYAVVQHLKPLHPRNEEVADVAIARCGITRKQFGAELDKLTKAFRRQQTAALKEDVRAEKNERIADYFAGQTPRTAADLVAMFTAREGITVRYSGGLMDSDGNDLSPLDLRGSLCDIFERLGLKGTGVEKTHLKVAQDKWIDAARQERVAELIAPMFEAPQDPEIGQKFEALCGRCFDCNSFTPAAFYADMLREGIYQTKRKMMREDVFDHIWPVIVGDQGSGKTLFLDFLLAALGEMYVVLHSAAEITDVRSHQLWSFFGVLLSEMGGYSKAEMDQMKGKVSAKRGAGRPMTTNNVVDYRMNTTLWGDSNRFLDQLSTDGTGERRLVGMLWKLPGIHSQNYRERNAEVWQAISEFNFRDLWRSVNHTAEAPQKRWQDVMTEVRNEGANIPLVRRWMDALTDEAISKLKTDDNGRFVTSELFKHYRVWVEAESGYVKADSAAFGRELHRVAAIQPEISRFYPVKNSQGRTMRGKDGTYYQLNPNYREPA